MTNFLRKDLELKNKIILQLQKENAESNQQHKSQISKLEIQIEEMKLEFSQELLTKTSELSLLEKGLNQKDDIQVSEQCNMLILSYKYRKSWKN